ncbi:hypothetical protein J4414_02780 [Candidatus Woesearchaeota archaeon]|nr:hypothetical protein [Candidatus Woesearchaeota archaeon]
MENDERPKQNLESVLEDIFSEVETCLSDEDLRENVIKRLSEEFVEDLPPNYKSRAYIILTNCHMAMGDYENSVVYAKEYKEHSGEEHLFPPLTVYLDFPSDKNKAFALLCQRKALLQNDVDKGQLAFIDAELEGLAKDPKTLTEYLRDNSFRKMYFRWMSNR